jgi:hypothetical protein
MAKRCACGAFAATAGKIRQRRDVGRLLPKHAARLLPNLDHPPPSPLCTHCLVRWLADAYAAEADQIRARFWGSRLTSRRRNLSAWRKSPPCRAHRTDGSPCCARAKRGSRFCHAHQPRPHWALRPKQLGKQCKAKARSGEQCKNRAGTYNSESRMKKQKGLCPAAENASPNCSLCQGR